MARKLRRESKPLPRQVGLTRAMDLLAEHARLGGRILSGHLAGRRRPLLAGFKLTRRCNLHCTVCPFWRQPAQDMDYASVIRALDRLQGSGVRFLIIEGGEPFLWRDGTMRLDDVVAAAQERFFCVGVVTNGTFPLELPADVIWVSVDGLRDTHNRNRGPIFDRVLAHIEASSHPRLYANITINRLNWQEIPSLVEFLVDRVVGVTIQFYYPYAGTEELGLAPERRRWVLDELIRMKRQGYPVADSEGALEALKENTWRCHPWLLMNVEPDGEITQGCYLSQRAEIACQACGFAAHTELSMAYDLIPGAIATGRRVFGLAGPFRGR